MKPQEKAKELLKSYSRLVYPYEGSSMLINTEFDHVILKHSKTCAIILVNGIISEINKIEFDLDNFELLTNRVNYWEEVKNEIFETKVL